MRSSFDALRELNDNLRKQVRPTSCVLDAETQGLCLRHLSQSYIISARILLNFLALCEEPFSQSTALL